MLAAAPTLAGCHPNEESCCATHLSLQGCPSFCPRGSQPARVLHLRSYPRTFMSSCLCDLLQPSPSLSLWLLQLVRPPAANEAGLVMLHGLCVRKSAHRFCVSISAALRVSLAIFGESALIHQIYCLGVTISTSSLLYE